MQIKCTAVNVMKLKAFFFLRRVNLLNGLHQRIGIAGVVVCLDRQANEKPIFVGGDGHFNSVMVKQLIFEI